MTMDATVVRRFELPVGRPGALGLMTRAVTEAAAPFGLEAAITRVEHPPLLDVRLEGPASSVAAVMKSLATMPRVRIRRDITRVRRERPDGARYPDRRARLRIGAGALSLTGGVPVPVAIVDSGLMVAHPAFKGHLWKGPGGIHGKQFIAGQREDDIHDQDGHGTLVAGTVLAAALGAPVELMTAKFIDAANPARPDNAADALQFATDHGAKIVVLAWDVGLGSRRLEEAFRRACAHALVVIAAGNYGSDNDWYDGRSWARVPVRYTLGRTDTTITVMATDAFGEKAPFSSYGVRTVDLAAPGTGITSTRRSVSRKEAAGHAFGVHGGTSAAAAHVAGAAALLMSRYPGLGVDRIKGSLTHSVDTVPELKCASKGRLNVEAALGLAAKGGLPP
jgi:subtilisin family serine protease